METPKSNNQLQVEIREELASEVSVDSNAIGITADHGFVSLSGHVLGVTQRRSVEEAALRVDGVRAVIDELKVRPVLGGSSDADLACLAASSLDQLVGLPDGRVKVIVRDGEVRLKGLVSRPEDKEMIGATARNAIGRNGIMDNAISIEPGISSALDTTQALTMPTFIDSSATVSSPCENRPGASWPGTSTQVVVDESFTDQGIPMRSVHHREFPEIHGRGETTSHGLAQLFHRLDRALEEAREAWRREQIEQVILDLIAYYRCLRAESADTASTIRVEVCDRLDQVAQPSLEVAIH